MNRWLAGLLVGACWIAGAETLFADGPKNLVIVAGRPSHRRGMHEFNAGSKLLEKVPEGLSARQNHGHHWRLARR